MAMENIGCTHGVSHCIENIQIVKVVTESKLV